MGTNSGTTRRKCKFPLLFSVNCDRGRIEIDHLYGLRCRGWYCNPEQHSLCRPARPAQLVLFRIAVPTTPAQTVSWSIPITINGSDNVLALTRRRAIIGNSIGMLLIGPLGTIFGKILIEIVTFSFMKMRLEVSAGTDHIMYGDNILCIMSKMAPLLHFE